MCHRWCTNLKERRAHLPQSNMGKALSYLLGNWEQLSRYLEDGRLEIDDNLVENAIRPTAIGKNYAQFAVMRRGRIDETLKVAV